MRIELDVGKDLKFMSLWGVRVHYPTHGPLVDSGVSALRLLTDRHVEPTGSLVGDGGLWGEIQTEVWNKYFIPVNRKAKFWVGGYLHGKGTCSELDLDGLCVIRRVRETGAVCVWEGVSTLRTPKKLKRELGEIGVVFRCLRSQGEQHQIYFKSKSES